MQGQQIAKLPSAENAKKSEIRSFEQRLTDLLPKWIRMSDLDAPGQFYPPTVPHSQGDLLRQLADENEKALAPCGPEVAAELLTHLRLTTRLNNDSDFEKTATFRSLVKAMAAYPEDLVREACRLFTARPTEPGGSNWFPRSSGELITYINPLFNRRRIRSWRLRDLATRSDNAVDPNAIKDSWEKPIPLDEVEEMNFFMRRIGSRTRWHPETGIKFELGEDEEDPSEPKQGED